MYKPNGKGFKRIYRASKCSIDGIQYAYTHESAFRQELMLCCALVPAAFWLTSDAVELVLLIAPLILLLAIECMNSAVEAAIDRISSSRHPLSKQAKDLGSAAVFFAIVLVLFSWLTIAWRNLGSTASF